MACARPLFISSHYYYSVFVDFVCDIQGNLIAVIWYNYFPTGLFLVQDKSITSVSCPYLLRITSVFASDLPEQDPKMVRSEYEEKECQIVEIT